MYHTRNRILPLPINFRIKCKRGVVSAVELGDYMMMSNLVSVSIWLNNENILLLQKRNDIKIWKTKMGPMLFPKSHHCSAVIND